MDNTEGPQSLYNRLANISRTLENSSRQARIITNASNQAKVIKAAEEAGKIIETLKKSEAHVSRLFRGFSMQGSYSIPKVTNAATHGTRITFIEEIALEREITLYNSARKDVEDLLSELGDMEVDDLVGTFTSEEVLFLPSAETIDYPNIYEQIKGECHQPPMTWHGDTNHIDGIPAFNLRLALCDLLDTINYYISHLGSRLPWQRKEPIKLNHAYKLRANGLLAIIHKSHTSKSNDEDHFAHISVSSVGIFVFNSKSGNSHAKEKEKNKRLAAAA